ncbi:MAG TPA: hypothetical protein VM869_19390 [Enhygromyxa sp.]|jgi:hypothetical protein|nr:hypothetical protein [Enhygromyxa sp.]
MNDTIEKLEIISVSRYGTTVRLWAMSGSLLAETELPVDYHDDHPRSKLGDEERLHWAIDWAIEQLAARGAKPC